MIQLATLRHPLPHITTSRPSRPLRSRSPPYSSSRSSSPPSHRHSNSWPVLPGATRAATWWRLHLWTPTRSPLFTRTSCRSRKGPQNNLSCITATFARSVVQARRYKSTSFIYGQRRDAWFLFKSRETFYSLYHVFYNGPEKICKIKPACCTVLFRISCDIYLV